ncbi:hypothetical protein V6N12_035845 [Hibiscus sabdariffa]|uniref:Reverse transcriptase/retrotransposon-derived protein RNase H-like domain-containing protein n=1 Tax=Hibiscus sabdariffa TaxID=183260 RepID=A0ABR2EQP0_9ROSI
MKMIDVASGGALVNMTPKATRELISTMAANSQQFSCKLPSQTENNPRANVSAITLRSGTVLEPKAPKENTQKKDKDEELSSNEQDKSNPTPINSTPIPSSSEVPPPFPSRLVKQDKQAEEKEILDIFRKVEVNIPHLEVIRRILRNFENCDNEKNEEFENIFSISSNLSFDSSKSKTPPPILQAPKLELKQLPEHLKYSFLGENETLPVVVSSKLTKAEENDLVIVLRAHKEAIGWTLADIKDLAPRLACIELTQKKGFFFQISMTLEDQEKTTFTCPFDTFAYRRMSIGLCNAPNTFQRCMISIFSDYVEKASKSSWMTSRFTVILLPSNWDYPFELMYDVSDTSVGVVLSQIIGKELHVIAYASCTLDSA